MTALTLPTSAPLTDAHFARLPTPYARQLAEEHKARHARFKEMGLRQRALPAPVAVAIAKTTETGIHVSEEKPKSAQFLAAHAALKQAVGVRTLDVQRVVAEHYGLTVNDLTCSARFVKFAWPRQIAIYIVKLELPRKGMPEIGREFGGRDHTTVIAALRKVAAHLESDPDLADKISAIRACLVRPTQERKSIPRSHGAYELGSDGEWRPAWHFCALRLSADGRSLDEISETVGKSKGAVRLALNINGARDRGKAWGVARRAKITAAQIGAAG